MSIQEDEFHQLVKTWLEREYGSENVEHEVYLSEPYRFVDFVVDTPLTTFVIEVENGSDSIIEGVGQAILYSGAAPSYQPLVLVPHGVSEQPEGEWLSQRVPVVEAPEWLYTD